MISRHKAREIALQILYRYDVASHGNGPTSGPTAKKSSQEMISELTSHFQHFDVPEPLREFAGQLVAGSLSEITRLDELLEKHASNWKVSRMSFVDRSLLRMAAYELINFPDTPASVVIDEAIELAKQFGNQDTPSFVNGILDSIKGEVRR
jgi:transcription antitermination protein NusB